MAELFINPWFLAGVAGAAVPLLIHLLVRRRYRRTPWAAMDLLIRAFKKTNRRLRLENWLVLFLRMLAVALVAFALARPVLRGSGIAAKIGEKNRSVFLLLDDSYSMGYKRGRSTPFEGAKKAASEILASLNPGSDTASLILVSGIPEVVYGEPTPELEKVKQALNETQPGYGISDLARGLDRLEEILAMPGVARAPNKEVYFFTDGQKLAWVPGEEGGTTQLTKKLSELAPKLESFAAVVVGDEASENLAVLELAVEDRVVGLDKHATFTVTVANFGPDPEDAYVEFLVDGNAWSSTHLSLPGGGRQTAQFAPVFRTPGPHFVTARLGADSLLTDNEQFHAIRVRERIRVLIVDGEPASETGGGLFSGETAHLELALLPAEDPVSAEGLSIIRPEVVRHFELTPNLFARGWELVILANEGRTLPMETGLMDSLHQYIKNGGSLLIFLGDRVRAEDYNDHLFQGGEGFLPLKIGKVKGSPLEPVGLKYPAVRHPVLKIFDDPELINAFEVPLTRHYFSMDVPDPLPKNVLIVCRFQTGEPAIVEKKVEDRGRVMVVATSADSEWTDLPGQYLFLPLIHEMVYYLVREDVRRRNLPVGDWLVRPLTRAEYAEDIAVVLPAGGRAAVEPPREVREGFFQASYGPLAEPGPYELQLRKGTEGEGFHLRDVFCANVNGLEGDLTRITEEFVKALVPPEMQAKFSYSRESYKRETSRAPGGAEVWKALLVALLAVLLVETVLARRFGDYAR